MNTNETEHQWQKLFREWQQRDAATAPPFTRLAATPRPAPSAPGTPWAWLAPAALAILIGGLFVDRMVRPDHPGNFDPAPWAALSSWETPSDEFLDLAESVPNSTQPMTPP